MRKILFGFSALVTALFFIGMTSPNAFAQTTITVPDDYPAMQLAIDFANPGDTVYVRSGTYYEHITINKEGLILTGEDRETTIVDGNGTGNVINVSASNVTISGLKITNGVCGIYSPHHHLITLHVTIRNTIIDSNDYGISAGDEYHWLIEDCIISNNSMHGLYLNLVNRFVIQNCEIFGNESDGVHLYYCADWPIFENNSIHHNGARGIYCTSLQGARIVQNHVFSNGGPGIYLTTNTHGNDFIDNIIQNNEYGIRNVHSAVSGNEFYHNDIIDNFVQVEDYWGYNFWDDGYPSGGNYWSDYTGEDLNDDGIGDTPYIISPYSQDNYPLMRPLWAYISVTIDIKPGSYPNSINLGSNGNVPVAILSTEDFDATTVDPLTVTLAGASVRIKGKGTPQASTSDVNGDGLLDLIVHVDTTALQLSGTDTDAILEGMTDGQKIRGVDTVRIIHE